MPTLKFSRDQRWHYFPTQASAGLDGFRGPTCPSALFACPAGGEQSRTEPCRRAPFASSALMIQKSRRQESPACRRLPAASLGWFSQEETEDTETFEIRCLMEHYLRECCFA